MKISVPELLEKIKPVKKPGKKKMSTKKKIMLGVGLCAVIASGVALYQLFFVEEPAEALTETVTHGSLATLIEGTATTVPNDSITYSTASNTEIQEIFVSAGDTVKVGDALYIQDDSDIDDLIYEYQELINDYEDTLSDYYSDQSDLYEDYANANITAPFSGKIMDINYEVDDSVQNGSTIARLVDDSQMEIVQYFSYAYEDVVVVGASAQVSIADQMMVLDGTVTEVSYVQYVTTEGTTCFAATIAVNNPGSLTEGMGAMVTVENYVYPVAAGELEFTNSKYITSELSSSVTGVYVVDHEPVTAGQLLFTLDADSVQDSLDSLASKIENCLESIDSNEERIEDCEEMREDYEVYSELEGTVIRVGITTDRDPSAGTTAVMIYNMDTMEISANIDELDIDYIEMGMNVDISYSSSTSTQTYVGTVTEISYEATNSNGVAYFPITISIDSAGLLSAGVNVSYSIAVGEESEGYLVPIDAIKTVEDETYVFAQYDKKPDNAVDVGDGLMPDGYYAIPVEITAVSSLYGLVLDGLEEGLVVFTRYQETAPSGGDTTSSSGEDEFVMPEMPEMPGMMSGTSGMSGMNSGMSSGGMSGMGR